MNKPRANRESIKTESLNIPMSKALKEKVSSMATKKDKSMGEIGRIILEDFFKKEERF
jgi:hypothetical protein